MVVDRELLVELWNDGAEAMWGLRAERVQGRHLLNLDIGLPVEKLRSPMLRFLAGETAHQEVTVAARHRSGRRFQCRVGCSAPPGTNGSVAGIVLLMEDVDPAGQADSVAGQAGTGTTSVR